MNVKTEPNVKIATPAKGTAECRSMTGYAMVRGEHGGWSIRVSVKSLNHRFLEVKLCMPDSLEPYELRLRLAEGRQLAEEMRARINRISEQAEKARGLVDTLQPMFTRRLESRLRELLSGVNVDAGRIAQEAALLAERSDLSEELDRLRSHLLQFRRLVDGAGEVGKKLDFLLQEMHREANTILSKTPGVESEALAVTGLSLEIKAEIEKLREQVQNLE